MNVYDGLKKSRMPRITPLPTTGPAIGRKYGEGVSWKGPNSRQILDPVVRDGWDKVDPKHLPDPDAPVEDTFQPRRPGVIGQHPITGAPVAKEGRPTPGKRPFQHWTPVYDAEGNKTGEVPSAKWTAALDTMTGTLRPELVERRLEFQRRRLRSLRSQLGHARKSGDTVMLAHYDRSIRMTRLVIARLEGDTVTADKFMDGFEGR